VGRRDEAGELDAAADKVREAALQLRCPFRPDPLGELRHPFAQQRLQVAHIVGQPRHEAADLFGHQRHQGKQQAHQQHQHAEQHQHGAPTAADADLLQPVNHGVEEVGQRQPHHERQED
jgi:hypothetical protein